MVICYVILHYKNIKDTIKCMDSLFELAAENSKFIIVDNGSKDGSGEVLKKKYSVLNRCDVLVLNSNVGFSKGNNVGYKFAKEKYHPDFIVMANNDVVFCQKEFEHNIVDIYSQTQFDVLGPDVFVPRHRDHQNPLFRTGITVEQLEKELDEYKFYQKNPNKFSRRLWIHAFKNRLCSGSRLINRLYSKLRGKDFLDYRIQYTDVGLQGSCLIFSYNYISREEKAFEPEPFLYEEEVFLFYKCKGKKYKMLYSPRIEIRHEEAASFTYAKKDDTDRLKFMLDHHVMAREMLLDYLISLK